MAAIHSLRDKFGGSNLFGNGMDRSFQGSLAAIYQTFGGADLYPSVEEKAALDDSGVTHPQSKSYIDSKNFHIRGH